MKFYIVTPTYNALDWLKRAIRSVADQVREGVEVHHHVQDGASKDGTQAWLEEWQRTHQDTPGYVFTYESCPDKGMYDALNHAWDKMPEDADITAHLNSDEQYLPDALAQLSRAFERRQDVDIFVTTFLFLNADGSYNCHYRPVRPTALRCRVTSMIRTSACFHRSSTFQKNGVRFDTRYKVVADRVFYSDVMKKHPRARTLPNLITTTDAITGANLAWSDNLQADEKLFTSEATVWILKSRKIIRQSINFARRIINLFCVAPREYAIYLHDDSKRTVKMVKKPTCVPCFSGLKSRAVHNEDEPPAEYQ